MSDDNNGSRSDRPTDDALHPLVYRTVVALAVWFVLAAWVFFDRGAGYVALALAMVTLFFVIVTGVPTLIWLTWRRNADAGEDRTGEDPFRDWLSHAFNTWTGRVSGREATVEILLPIAAAAVGMTLIGLAFLFAVPQLGAA